MENIQTLEQPVNTSATKEEKGKYVRFIPRFYLINILALIVISLISLSLYFWVTCGYIPAIFTTPKNILVFISFILSTSVFIYAIKNRYSIFLSIFIFLFQIFLAVVAFSSSHVVNVYDCGGSVVQRPIMLSSSIQVAKTNAVIKTYYIPEIGLSFNLQNSENYNLIHQIIKNSPTPYYVLPSVAFSTKEFEQVGCDTKDASLGILTYDSTMGGQVIGSIRGANLYYVYPNQNMNKKCIAPMSQIDILKEALKTVVMDKNFSY